MQTHLSHPAELVINHTSIHTDLDMILLSKIFKKEKPTMHYISAAVLHTLTLE